MISASLLENLNYAITAGSRVRKEPIYTYYTALGDDRSHLVLKFSLSKAANSYFLELLALSPCCGVDLQSNMGFSGTTFSLMCTQCKTRFRDLPMKEMFWRARRDFIKYRWQTTDYRWENDEMVLLDWLEQVTSKVQPHGRDSVSNLPTLALELRSFLDEQYELGVAYLD